MFPPSSKGTAINSHAYLFVSLKNYSLYVMAKNNCLIHAKYLRPPVKTISINKFLCSFPEVKCWSHTPCLTKVLIFSLYCNTMRCWPIYTPLFYTCWPLKVLYTFTQSHFHMCTHIHMICRSDSAIWHYKGGIFVMPNFLIAWWL